jgi:hypothetical protein
MHIWINNLKKFLKETPLAAKSNNLIYITEIKTFEMSTSSLLNVTAANTLCNFKAYL